MNYRSEIDGLRALAVLPVIFFHAGFIFFNGGFVGVDIFFVISGYLITSIIITEMEEKRFTISSFYERRARRILPALFFVMLACLPFSWIFLTPSDLEGFGKSLIAVSTFTSNILFWSESGYFEAAAELKPLIHTWSLAVEEQYYIIFPIFIIIFWRYGRKWILILLFISFILSLGLSHWGSVNKPSATFFLLPTRGWELLVGVFTAFYLKKFDYFKSESLNQLLSIFGFAMVGYAIFFYTEKIPFPSLYTLIPTIGTGLLILSATPKTIVGKLLSLRPIVSLGLISYSAYLWHQPILSFARHALPGNLSNFLLYILCAAALGMAYFSWHFVEKPFRNRKNFSQKSIFIFSFMGIIFFSLIGYNLYKNDGYISRLNDNEKMIYDFIDYETNALYREGVCFLKPEQDSSQYSNQCFEGEYLIWGDSHGAALSYGLRAQGNFSQLTSFACPPILHIDFVGRPNCRENNKFIIEKIKSGEFTKVFIHTNWIGYSIEEISKFKNTLTELNSINNDIDIFILGGVPQWQPSLPRYLVSSKVLLSNIEKDLYVLNSQFKKVKNRDYFIKNLIINNFANKIKFEFISIMDELCEEEKCIAVKADGMMQPYVWDYGHLTESGTNALAEILVEKINLED